MTSLKEEIEASAKEVVQRAHEVIRCAQELFQEGRIPATVLSETVKLCENGLPYAAEQDLLKLIARQMFEEECQDLPDFSIPFPY